MVILASEDIGNADPMALVVAVAAFQALEFVGLPEAKLNLSQAAIYLATAPKSNASMVAIGRATEDVQRMGAGRCRRTSGDRVPGSQAPRPRQGVPLPPRLSRRLGGPAVPPRWGSQGPPLLRATDHGAEQSIRRRLDELRRGE